MLFRNGLFPKSVANATADLKAFLRWLVRRKVLAAFPEFLSVSRGPESTEQPIGLDVQSAIIAQIPKDRRGIYLAMRTAICVGEARALNCEDCQGDVINVRHSMLGKGANARRDRERTSAHARLQPPRDAPAQRGITCREGSAMLNPKRARPSHFCSHPIRHRRK